MSSELDKRVSERLSRAVPSGARIRLALSGGRDSIVLFSILAELAPRLGYSFECMHVNHGISANANAWTEFCEALCIEEGIKLDVSRVSLQDVEKIGLEASARNARYAALSCDGADFVLMAHHLRDQAETVLLQLMRGAGVKGLSAMPGTDAEGRRRIIRPMLDEPASEIQAYAELRGLAWISDESNEDTRFSRNFIRRDILPRIEERFPGAITSIARSASHLGESQRLLEDLADIDLSNLRMQGGLDVCGLRKLSEARAKNVLRTYFAQHNLEMPQSAQLDELLRQTKSARVDGTFKFALGALDARIYRNVLLLERVTEGLSANFELRWNGESVWQVKTLGGALRFTPAVGNGVCAKKLGKAPVTVRLRKGGERMRMSASRPRRTLKNLLRESGIPFWVRERLPLLYCGDELVFVPGIGIAYECRAQLGEPGIALEWIDSSALG